jgi:hypothetical protein
MMATLVHQRFKVGVSNVQQRRTPHTWHTEALLHSTMCVAAVHCEAVHYLLTADVPLGKRVRCCEMSPS